MKAHVLILSLLLAGSNVSAQPITQESRIRTFTVEGAKATRLFRALQNGGVRNIYGTGDDTEIELESFRCEKITDARESGRDARSGLVVQYECSSEDRWGTVDYKKSQELLRAMVSVGLELKRSTEYGYLSQMVYAIFVSCRQSACEIKH